MTPENCRLSLRPWFTLAVVLSLLLCVMAGALWARSYWQMDVVRRWNADRRTEQIIISSSGAVRLTANRYIHDPVAALPAGAGSLHRIFHPQPLVTEDPRARLGVRVTYEWGVMPPDYEFYVRVPYWLIVLLTGILPAAWTYRWLTRKPAPGCCRACGYDLRATPDRCPECGAITSAGDQLAETGLLAIVRRRAASNRSVASCQVYRAAVARAASDIARQVE
jgi:hypothetical protein